MSTQSNIVLVGFMGTGKTTVGLLLARRLALTFVDMDTVIESREGMPIARIFAEKGEPHFRAAERALVLELSRPAGLVIGTGGGVVVNPANVRDLSRRNLVACLSASPLTLLARLKDDTTRPLLAGGDKLAKMEALLAKRRALYDAIPFQVRTDGLTPEQAADTIESRYRTFAAPPED